MNPTTAAPVAMPVAAKPPLAKICSDVVVRALAQNVSIQTEIEPLVTVYPDEEFLYVYHLYILLYLMDGCSQPQLGTDLNNFESWQLPGKTDVWLRQLCISYQPPALLPECPTYTLWDIHCSYQLSDAETAFGLHTFFEVGDPKTSRGTVTVVLRS
jgi:hypothetical protein